MSRIWQHDPKKVDAYICSKCGRHCYVTTAGYMPIHRHKGKRGRCDGSGSHSRFHKKVS